MQTFVPEGLNLTLGFQRLDYKRLGKQRVEAWQILNVLRGVDNDGKPKDHKGWVNHPATRMWESHIPGLAMYGMLCSAEWIHRGYNDTMYQRFSKVVAEYERHGMPIELPTFLDDLAESHKSNLIRKLPSHYRPFWPTVPDNMPYYWPK